MPTLGADMEDGTLLEWRVKPGDPVKRGQVMRLYVPFAEDWKYAVHYLKRRLAANPAMALMVMKNMFGN